jgi:hypothetical protein
VNNEWRGTFEEFEEAVEFGELDLFLRVEDGEPLELPDEPAAEEQESAAPAAPAPAAAAPAESSTRSTSHSTLQPMRGLAQPRSISHAGPAAAPSVPLPHALPQHGARAEPSADAILAKLAPADLELNDDDVDAMLAEIAALSVRDRERKKEAPPVEEKKEERRKGTYPDLGAGNKPAVPRTYVPSATAGTAPLRLARMGSGTSMARDVSASSSSSSSSAASSTPSAPRAARYNASQISSRALAAEASASAASRALSTKSLARAVSDGTDLPTALQGARSEVLVGREDPDALLASLGLGDLQLTEEEAEAFLESGIIPEGAASGGGRVKKGKEEKVREETAAREVASRARSKGYTGSPMEPRKTSFAKERDGVEEKEDKREDSAASAVGLGLETQPAEPEAAAKGEPDVQATTVVAAVGAEKQRIDENATSPEAAVKKPEAASDAAASETKGDTSAPPTSSTAAEAASTAESGEAVLPSPTPAVSAAAVVADVGVEDTPRAVNKALPSLEDAPGSGEGSTDTMLASARPVASAAPAVARAASGVPEPVKPVSPTKDAPAAEPFDTLAKSSSTSSITPPAVPAAEKPSASAPQTPERAVEAPRTTPSAQTPEDAAAIAAAAAAAAAAEAAADADARDTIRLLLQGTDFGADIDDKPVVDSKAADAGTTTSTSSIKPAALRLEPSPLIALASPGPSSSSASPPSPKSPKSPLSTRSSRSPLVSRSPISPLSNNATAQVRRQPSDPRSPVLSPSRRGLDARRREPGSASMTPSGSASSFSSLGALHSPVGASPRSVSSPVTGIGGISRSASTESKDSKKGRFSLAGMLNSAKLERTSSASSNAGGSPVSIRSMGAPKKEERASKTLSQILREADAAMAEEEEEEEMMDGDDMAWEGEDVREELRI